MFEVLTEINSFTETPPFVAMVKELRDLPNLEDRKRFVKEVIINKAEQQKRGINPPDGMVIQRSHFTDNRPTLFCVVKYLRDGQRKMTLTFDDDADFSE
jgi:hypothetical protein